MSSPASLTADDLLHVRLPHQRVELVRGQLVVREPAGYTHGRVAMNLAIQLGTHLARTGAGQLFAAETGFTLARGPDTVRAPDIAFIRRERLPAYDPVGFPELAPDLVAEVLSPDDRPGATLAKVADWLSAGVRLVWVIDPARRLARVYRHDGTELLVPAEGALDGEDVVSGFTCPIATIL